VQIAQLGSAMGAFEGGVATPAGGVLLWGWMHDPDGEVESLTAELDGKVYAVDLLDRTLRPEVAESFGADWRRPTLDLGWIAVVRLAADASIDGPMRVRFGGVRGDAVSGNRLRPAAGASLTRLLAPHLPLSSMSPSSLRRLHETIWRPEAARLSGGNPQGSPSRSFGPETPVDLSLVLPWTGKDTSRLRETLAYLDMDAESAALEVVLVLADGQDQQQVASAVLSAATDLAVTIVDAGQALTIGAAVRAGVQTARATTVALMSGDVVPPSGGWIGGTVAAAAQGTWLAPARMPRFDGLPARVRPWPSASGGGARAHQQAEAGLDAQGLDAWSPGFVAIRRDHMLSSHLAWNDMITPHGFWTALLSHAVRNGAVPFAPAEAFTLVPPRPTEAGEEAWALLDLYALAGRAVGAEPGEARR
jgi:hypothetical protein